MMATERDYRLPLSAPLFSKQAKGKTRFVFRAGIVALLLLAYGGMAALSVARGAAEEAAEDAAVDAGRRLSGDDDDGGCGEAADPAGLIALFIIGMLYMFLALAIVCDEYFVPALEVMADEMKLTNDVAGATLMAAGGSAPELFTSFFGTFQNSDVGFGTIVGSAVFNVLFVIGMCALFSKEVLELTWWPLARDCAYYSLSLSMLAVFFGGITANTIRYWEAIILLAMYGGYVTFMAYNERIHKFICQRFNLEYEDDDANATFVKPSTFRAGILRILNKEGNALETAAIAVVSQITGDVKETFDKIDENGNGKIEEGELEVLLRKLGTEPRPGELAEIMKEIDNDNDGVINFQEFTVWYIGSEERLKGEVKTIFDELDTNKSGSVGKEQLRDLLLRLGSSLTDGDLADAMKDLDKNGDGQINFPEFAAWYEGSMFWTMKKHEADEAAEVSEGLDPFKYPEGESLRAKFFYCLTFPLMLLFYVTMPDVRKPGRQGVWAFACFFMAIAWIGVFSYFMVGWAEIVGNTIGIPPVVMGLTVLAAGTSVPDLLSSVIVARQGEGDMAVSSSIGSNIFDVLVGLPLPWLAYSIIRQEDVTVGADNLFLSVVILLGMLVAVIITIVLSGWKMTQTLGGTMFVLYAIFVAQDLARVTDWGC